MEVFVSAFFSIMFVMMFILGKTASEKEEFFEQINSYLDLMNLYRKAILENEVFSDKKKIKMRHYYREFEVKKSSEVREAMLKLGRQICNRKEELGDRYEEFVVQDESISKAYEEFDEQYQMLIQTCQKNGERVDVW